MIEKLEETIADLQLEVKEKSEALSELANLEEKLMVAEKLASQSQTVSERLQGAADELGMERQKFKRELEEACITKNQLTKELEANQKEAEVARRGMEELQRLGEAQAKELAAARSCMVEEQQQVAAKLAEATKQLSKVEEEKEEMEMQMRALLEQIHQKKDVESNLKQVEGRLADVE